MLIAVVAPEQKTCVGSREAADAPLVMSSEFAFNLCREKPSFSLRFRLGVIEVRGVVSDVRKFTPRLRDRSFIRMGCGTFSLDPGLTE